MKLDLQHIHQRITQLLRRRYTFVLATIVEVKGSCPQKAGARMIVHPDGTFEYTIGGGTFEAEVLRDALAAFDGDPPVTRQYRLTKQELGMYCQGLVTVMLEPFRPSPQLLLFGGGHVGQALSKIAGASELFSVVVIDDREEFADRKKHRLADKVIHTDREFKKGVPSSDENTFVVVATRCHATDKTIVLRYLNERCAYLGLIGSQAKVNQFRKELLDEGASPVALQRLHSPIGLPIGGKNPAEIAISILAELIQVKNSIRSPHLQMITSVPSETREGKPHRPRRSSIY